MYKGIQQQSIKNVLFLEVMRISFNPFCLLEF